MSVKIIVLTKNSKTLERCLEAIYCNTTGYYELWIVNGGKSLDEIVDGRLINRVTVSVFDMSHNLGAMNFQLGIAIDKVDNGLFVCRFYRRKMSGTWRIFLNGCAKI